MVGAFTTTGLPVFENDFLPRILILWRALIAWFGGGIIWVVAFVILLPASRGGFDIFPSKKVKSNLNRNLTLDERSITLNKTSRKLIPIYISLTFILWCALTSLGTDGFTSLIRAFSILSTSGIPGPEKFSLDGAGFYGEFVMAIFLLTALSYNIYYSLSKKVILRKVLFDREIRLGLLTVVCVTIVLSLKEMSLNNNMFNFTEFFVSGFRILWGNLFTVFSFMTTNGYVSSHLDTSSSSFDLTHITIIFLGLCLFGGG